ncbi:uncharacterized protein LOC122307868 [Carya illinoinensis]|uniref:Uncharacterized protein n=1 Tax=Carya illinoinensis TaxID=32201 RepID=A0A8T1QTW9_CARIL|nr:uncharacterized protein LOC122307868 [Carya illinoinensis]KAG6657431.1 hypothetical protein CIPAW_04G090500 [Carya illinoinensis]
MASERHNDKTMRKLPEDDESPVVKQEEDFGNNIERGTKPNNVLPTSEHEVPDPSKKNETEGRLHSKNHEEIPSDRPQFQGGKDSVPQQKEKIDMLLKEHKANNGRTQDSDPSKRIATEEAKLTSNYTATKNTPLPLYRPGENTSTFPNNVNPSDKKKDPGNCCPCCSIL